MDITNEQEIIDGFKWTVENVGPVHILINNAGVVADSDLSDCTVDAFRKVFDTNVLGLSIATREALKQMVENDIVGHVVHINSVLGHK